MRGIYLPLLLPPEQCVKEPLSIYYIRSHFTVLVRADSADMKPEPGLLPLDFVEENSVNDVV